MARTRRPSIVPLEDRAVPASVSGTVFADANGDGVRDPNEIGLANVSVMLLRGEAGAGDQSASTDAAGNFTFTNVPDSNANVLIFPPTGTTMVGSASKAIVVAGNDVTNVDFSVRPNGTISGAVFGDLNGNGLKDATEPGLPGVPVSLDQFGDGSAIFNTTTKADGSYQFLGVVDGTGKVTISAPTGQQYTTPITPTVPIVSGAAAKGVNFGLLPSSAIAGRVLFGAANGPGSGVGGLTVNLDAHSNGTTDLTATTDADGNYYFASAPNGTHTISVVAPNGGTITTPGGNGKLTVTVSDNVLSNQNFGLTYAGSVSGSTYLDVNNNRTRDDGERAIPPGKVQVLLNGTGNPIEVPFTMNANGTFSVAGLPDGKHVLLIATPGSYSATGTTRANVTVTGGVGTVADPIAVRNALGSSLTVGNANGQGITPYAFTTNPNGTLTPTAGTAITTTTESNSNRVVTADFNGDGTDDQIVATGAGERAMIHVYDGTSGTEIVPGGIAIFESTYMGGLYISAGDFNGDGKADVVASADNGGGPRVQILNAAQYLPGADASRPRLIADFFGIDDPRFRGGARTAVGDLNNDGTVDLVVAAGTGGGPRVAMFDGTSLGMTPTRLVADFFAYESRLRNGAVAAVGDVNGDGKADLVVGAGPGGAPRVTAFSGTDLLANMGSNSGRIADFYVNGDTASRSGTRVAVKDLDKDGKADIVSTSAATVYAYTSTTLSNYYVNPALGQTAPAASASFVPYSTDTAGLFVG